MKTGAKILTLLITAVLIAIGISISLHAYDVDKASLGNLVGVISLLIGLIGIVVTLFTSGNSTAAKESTHSNKRWIVIACIIVIGVPAISYFFTNQKKEHAQNEKITSEFALVRDSIIDNTKALVSPQTKTSSEQKEKSSNAEKTPSSIPQKIQNTSSAEETPAPIKQEITPNDLSAENAYKEGKNAAQNNNYSKAVKYYQSAADRGIAAAAYELALLCQVGKGCVKNESLAFKYMKNAADTGYANAFRPLGEMYHGGKGVAKDRKVAEDWYKKAADLGDETAKRILYNM